MEKKQLVPFHCSLHICTHMTWADGEVFSDTVLSILEFIDYFSRVLSVVMDGCVSPPTQLPMLPGGSQLVLPGSKWHLNTSNWDCFYANRETCEATQYEELGTISCSGFWKHPELVREWGGAESVPEPLQAPSAKRPQNFGSGLCFQSDLYALFCQSLSKLSFNIFFISF